MERSRREESYDEDSKDEESDDEKSNDDEMKRSNLKSGLALGDGKFGKEFAVRVVMEEEASALKRVLREKN